MKNSLPPGDIPGQFSPEIPFWSDNFQANPPLIEPRALDLEQILPSPLAVTSPTAAISTAGTATTEMAATAATSSEALPTWAVYSTLPIGQQLLLESQFLAPQDKTTLQNTSLEAEKATNRTVEKANNYLNKTNFKKGDPLVDPPNFVTPLDKGGLGGISPMSDSQNKSAHLLTENAISQRLETTAMETTAIETTAIETASFETKSDGQDNPLSGINPQASDTFIDSPDSPSFNTPPDPDGLEESSPTNETINTAAHLLNNTVEPNADTNPGLFPTVNLSLQQDTGYSSVDSITAHPTVMGQVSSAYAIVALMAFSGTQTLEEAVNIHQSLQSDGSFILEAEVVSLVLGEPLLAGDIAFNVVAIDELGQSSIPAAIRFMFIADSPEITQVYAVREDILALEIEAGRTQYGRQVPFSLNAADTVEEEGGSLWVTRRGTDLGALAGPVQDVLYTFDKFLGTPLDLTWADSIESYLIRTEEAPSQTLIPTAVFRKSKPTDMARVARWEYEWPLRHTLYLDLPEAMAAGETYTIELPGSEFKSVTYLHRPDLVRSEAVHVSQVGFRPDDPVKVGYLSTWAGNGGGLFYANDQIFWLVEADTNEIVYGGQSTLARPMTHEEDPRGRDHTLTEVHQLDFSEFDQPGRYRLCVDGIGCSFTFEIAPDTWQSAFYVAARGFYHQRSGIALESPYTHYHRPRAFHPDDGLKIYQSQTTVMDTTKGIGDAEDFETLVTHRTDTLVPNVWGGYFDAGDWDRHIQHLQVSRSLLELADLFPTYYTDLSLNIPESDNAIPDVIDEALWSLDFFTRLQTPDGGIPGGVESAEHPRWGEASWQESLTVMMYAPDLWSSYIYAGVAARAAYTLRNLDPARADRYTQRALRAMAYAEAAYAALDDIPFPVRDERNLAALELFRLTGEASWHDVFLDTTIYTDPGAEPYIYDEQLQRDAGFLYAQLEDSVIDPTIQQQARDALIREADSVGELTAMTGFSWTKNHPYAPVGWGEGLGSPKAQTILRAHALTGDEGYLSQALRASQYSVGANPENLVYTTGLGQRSIQHPLIIDQRVRGLAPPPGITVYGPLDVATYDDYWVLDLLAEVTTPNPYDWPTAEGYFDTYLNPAMTEFTVMESMNDVAYTWGYLAARASD
ncbi:MAG: glycoside hydrolase family 9 protein [Cyanobacteria bacterium P01_A01_bin.105]